ncbi:MAG: tetratricopeptide repeat protein [Armatimonadetes bacterium]|nr:tetratricopeptide repeat protein [Armatimonadota bacterium]
MFSGEHSALSTQRSRTMKRPLVKPGLLVLGLAFCLAAGVWTVRRQHGRVGAGATPISPSALLAMLHGTGDSSTDQMIARWAERAQQDPQNSETWANLGEALMQKARETMDAGYYSRAEVVFRKALALNPSNLSALTGMASVTGCRHEFEQSIEWANKAIALDPKNHAAYGLLGDAAVEMGDYKAAFQHLQRMLDIRPDLSSYSRGAHLLFLTGDVRKATWLMQKAIAAGAPHAENTAWCRAQLALMLWNVGALLAAEQVLEKALKQTPNDYHLLVAMGKVKASRKEYPAAIDSYKKAIAIAPQHEAVVALGDLYAQTGRKDEAERQFALVEQIHGLNKTNGVRGDAQMARFYADHDRYLPQALKMAEEEYKARPNVFAADTLAWCYYKCGRYEDARKTILQALSQGTPDASLLFHAGMIHAKLCNRVAAQKYLYRALSLNPNFHSVYAAVAADTLKRLGSTQEKEANRG